MAITEADKLKLEGKTKEESISEAKAIIRASARYERLVVLGDFQDMLKDLENLKKVHEAEVKGWTEQLEGTSFFKKMRLVEVISVHQIRANQIIEALAYFPKLKAAADEARMFLRAITEEEQAHATRN